MEHGLKKEPRWVFGRIYREKRKEEKGILYYNLSEVMVVYSR